LPRIVFQLRNLYSFVHTKTRLNDFDLTPWFLNWMLPMPTISTFAARASLIVADIKTALALLTRLPVNAKFDRTAAATWAFPIVGLILGVLVSLIASIASWLGLPSTLCAGIAIAAGIIFTGAMHEDGLADSADGLWGGWDKTRRLEIMRDSHIGTYGVLALILALLLRFTALTSLIHAYELFTFIIAASILSRAAIPYVMVLLPHARTDGLSVQTGRASRKTASTSATLACVLVWVFIGFVPMVFASCAVAFSTYIVIKIARSKIGGQTGDILGASQVLAELAVLAVFTALL
jgi:adenosylcobinamide-GDP ribazoletransferase